MRFDEATSELTVLFCGEEFGRGFQFTCEACTAHKGLKVVRCPRKDVAAHISTADVIVPLMTRLDSQLLAKATKAKLVLQFGVGVEGVDIPAATELGVQVSNIPSNACANALSCAEMAIYLMLACLRRAHEMEASVRKKVLGLPIGDTIFGKTCLIVGFGNIAKELAPRLKALGTRLIGVRQGNWEGSSQTSAAQQLLDLRVSWQQRFEAASQADVIVMTCTETPATRGVINSEFLENCKAGVIIINVARGGLLDYEAVKQGLKNGRIGALGLDVQWQEPFDPADELAQHPRVYLTPHVAGVTEPSYRGMAEIVAQEALRLRAGLPASVQLNQVKLIASEENGSCTPTEQMVNESQP